MMSHKDEVVLSNTKGVEFLFKKNKVDRVEATGRIAGAGFQKLIRTGFGTSSVDHCGAIDCSRSCVRVAHQYLYLFEDGWHAKSTMGDRPDVTRRSLWQYQRDAR
jgi:hypothetical protein